MNISPLKLEAGLTAALPDFALQSEYPNQRSQFVGTNKVCTLGSTTLPDDPQPYRCIVKIACYSGDRYTVQSMIEQLADAVQVVDLSMVGQTATSWKEVFRSGVQWDSNIQAHYQYLEFDFAIRVDS